MSAELSYLTAEIYDTKTINLYWGAADSANISYVNIEQSFNGKDYVVIAKNVISQPYRIEGLTSNFIYFFRATPYDSSDIAGLPYITHIYLPYNTTIEKFHVGKVASTEIPLYWSGEFYSVYIEYKRSIDISYKSVTVTGNNSYQITNLVPATAYNFRLTPININGSKSGTTYSLNATTDIVSYINSISLASIQSTTAVISWAGNADYIKLQISTDGLTYSNAGTYNSYNNTSGNTTIYGLFPQTRYLFRIIPYNSSLEIGKPSSSIIGTTYQGFSEFYASYVGIDYIVLNWTGSYNKANLFKSSDGGVTYDLLTQLDNNTKTLTDYNITPYKYYYYYLSVRDGVFNVDVSSAILTVLSDFNSVVNADLLPATANSLSLNIYSTSMFLSLDVRISKDGGSTFYDLSNLTQNPQDGNFSYIIDYDGENTLSPNTSYQILLLPYSLYDHSPQIIKSTYTLGNITFFDFSYTNITSVVLSWQGSYSYVTLQYSPDVNFLTNTQTITGIADSSYNLTVTAGVAYYYRIIPANNNGVDAPPVDSPYFPVVNSIYFSDVSYSSATLNWRGKYSNFTLQVSTGSDFYDLYEDGTSTSYNLSLTGDEVTYCRVFPRNNNKDGIVSSAVYNPIIRDLNVVSMMYDASNSKLSLYWKGFYNYANLKYYYIDENFVTSQVIDISSYMIGNTIVLNDNYNLDTRHTSYTFILTPYAYGYSAIDTTFDVSGAVYLVTTPAIPTLYIGDIEYLSSVNSVKFNLNWDGTFTKVIIYYSTDGSRFSQIATIMNNSIERYSYVTTNLHTSYYRILPFNETVVGVSSDIIYIPSIVDLSLSKIVYFTQGQEKIELGWAGTYGNVTLQYSSDNSIYYDLSNNLNVNNFVINDTIIPGLSLTQNVYYFRLIPYCTGMSNKLMNYPTEGLTTAGVFNALIKSIYISNVYMNNIILTWLGAFDAVTIQYSNDGVTYSNLTGGVYVTGNSLSIVTTPHTTVYYKIIPYYSTSVGYIPCIQSAVTYIPSITNVYVSNITGNDITILWSGTYNYIDIQYSTDNVTYTTILSNVVNNTFTLDNTYVQDFSPQYETYYLREIPYSTVTSVDGVVSVVTGLPQITYNPTINYINIPYVSPTGITLQWVGKYNSVDIESSTGNGVWSVLYRNVTTSSISITTDGHITKYYKVTPYNSSTPSINGITSDIIYIPTVTTIAIDTITLNSITLKWPANVVYTYANLQYSTDNNTYTDLITNIQIGTYNTTVTDANISGLNTRLTTYYFKLVPYTYAYNNGSESNTIIGLTNTLPTYNPTLTNAYVIPFSDASTNTLLVYFSGFYSSAVIYYGIYGQPLFNTVQSSESSTGGYKYAEIPNLQSNTTYSFNIYPINSDNEYGFVSDLVNGTTISTLNNLNFEYDVTNSTYDSIRVNWLNNGYSSIQIYNATTSTLVYTTSNTSTYYDSSGVETLLSNSSYQYYATVYDSVNNNETTSNITVYTRSSPSVVNITYSIMDNVTDLSFSWNNYGYKSITIYNYTLHGDSPPPSNINTYMIQSGVTRYNSKTDGNDTLDYNSTYVYKITLTNDYDLPYTYYLTTYSAARGTMNVSYNASRYGPTSIPLDVSGNFAGFVIYTNDDETGIYTYGNTYVYGGPSSTAPTIGVSMNLNNSIVNQSNHQYSFKVAPFNKGGALSQVSSSVFTKTLGNITKFFVSNFDPSSVALYFDGSYEKVGIESATNTRFTENYNTVRLSSTGETNYIYNGLLSNAKYYFRITPINTLIPGRLEDISGIHASSSQTTMAKLTYFAYTNLDDISSTGIGVEWDGTQNYIDLQFSTNGTTYNDLGIYNTVYNYFTDLLPSTRYYFRAVPYNSVDVSSNIYYYFSAATRGVINNFSINSVIDNSGIQLYCSGSFERMLLNMATNSEFTDVTTRYIPYSSNNLYTINGLNSDQLYYFRAYPVNTIIFDPYNQIDACGNVFGTDIFAITYPSLSYLNVVPNDASSITLTWDGYYTDITLYKTTTSGIYTSSFYQGTTDSPRTLTLYNLLPNTTYYIKGTPYSSTSNLTGQSIVNVNTATYPQIISFYVSSVSSTSALITYNGAFTRLNITVTVYFNGNYVDSISKDYYREQGNTGTDISGLNALTDYVVTAIAYNVNGLTATTGTTFTTSV